MDTKENWYVIYTRSRHERVLAEQLEEAGYEIFLPLIKKQSRWSDRKKIIETPLFNSYVFIKGVNDRNELRSFRAFVAFLQYENKPAIVRQHEIDTLKLVLKHGYDVSEAGEKSELEKGSKVMVIGGPLKGESGYLIAAAEGERFILEFENFNNVLQVNIPAKALKRIYE